MGLCIRLIRRDRVDAFADRMRLFREERPAIEEQAGIVAKFLRCNTSDNPPGILNQRIQLLVGADIQLPEAVEELRQVFDRRIPEDLGLAVRLTGKPISEVGDQPRQFRGERFLGQLDGFIKLSLDPKSITTSATALACRPRNPLNREEAASPNTSWYHALTHPDPSHPSASPLSVKVTASSTSPIIALMMRNSMPVTHYEL